MNPYKIVIGEMEVMEVKDITRLLFIINSLIQIVSKRLYTGMCIYGDVIGSHDMIMS